MKTVAIVNQKGGVGKTTTCVNLASELGYMREKILVVDADPQGNCSTGLGATPGDGVTLYNILMEGEAAQWAVHSSAFQNVSLICASDDLVSADMELGTSENRYMLLRDALVSVSEDFDVALIDSPPSLGLLTLNVLAAADYLLVPVQCEYYALQGLSLLTKTVQRVRDLGLNPKIDISGILLTMYGTQLRLAREVEEQVRGVYGDRVFKTTIPRNVDLAVAPARGEPIREYKASSAGSKAYHQLAMEVKKLWL